MDNIDEVWKKAAERFPTSTTAWLKNFAGDLNRAKRAVTDALRIGTESGKEVERHHEEVLDRQTSSSRGGVRRSQAEEAVALLRLMAERPEMVALISSYLGDPAGGSREHHVLHVAAKNGYVVDLKRVIRPDQVDRPSTFNTIYFIYSYLIFLTSNKRTFPAVNEHKSTEMMRTVQKKATV